MILVGRTSIIALSFALLASLVGAGQAGANGNISIRGSELLRDGIPWVPKGVVVTGLISAAVTAGPVGATYVKARDAWGSEEVTAIKRYGADTINLKVSQPALDPEGGHYDPKYEPKIEAAVALARRAGLNVILSMQWDPPTGATGQLDMPTDSSTHAPESSTVRAWQVLAPIFGSDRGVMYQLFDEPCAKHDSPRTWRIWQKGHQAVIDAVRHVGARNVLIVEGIRCGKWLTAAPKLVDPFGSIAYAVHPFPMPEGVRRSDADMFTAADFYRNFGWWQSRGHVVIVTAWSINRANCHDGMDGNPTSPQIAFRLMQYVKARHIGLFGWAMDIPGAIWLNNQWRDLTRLEPFRGCRERGVPVGIGAMLRTYFKTGRIIPE